MDGFKYYDLEQDKIRSFGKFSYKADFKLEYKGLDKPIIWESKGLTREPYQIRKKLWYSMYRDDYYFVESKSLKHAKKLLSELDERIG